MKTISILVPSDEPKGPIKGALALANGLSLTHEVAIVFMRRSGKRLEHINEKVSCIWLSDVANSPFTQLKAYQNHLSSLGSRDKVVSISYCIQPDFMNVFCKRHACTISSVRGNLFLNYYYDKKILGLAIAFLHLFCMRFIDHIVVMNKSMASQVQKITGKRCYIIGNFIDEQAISKLVANIKITKSAKKKIMFVGSLSERKQPLLVLETFVQMVKQGADYQLEFIGSGPLERKLKRYVESENLKQSVIFHGFKKHPAILLLEADIFVLPSKSEGTSRAALEALFVGVPIVLRDVDSNSDLVQEGVNGYVFNDDASLFAAMNAAMSLANSSHLGSSLLPDDNHQQKCVCKFRQLINNVR